MNLAAYTCTNCGKKSSTTCKSCGAPVKKVQRSEVRGRCARTEPLGPSAWARLRATGQQEPCLGASPELLLARIRRLNTGGRPRGLCSRLSRELDAVGTDD